MIVLYHFRFFFIERNALCYAQVVAQHSSRNFVISTKAKLGKWEMFKERVPTAHELERKSKSPEELYNLAKDTSDYAWYSTRYVYMLYIFTFY